MGQEAAALADEITVIDIADPEAVPMPVSPLEPSPGYRVQAHADRVAGLLEAAFGLAAPVAEALRAGLRRAYADCGWDMRTGAARPGAVTSPAVPSFRELKLAVLAAAGELGYGPGTRAQVRGFLEARLGALWGGPAGRFLEGGHPADPARLLRGTMFVAGCGVPEREASAFLTGVLLLRLAEYLARRGRGRDGSRPAVVIASPDRLPGSLGPLPARGRAPGRGRPVGAGGAARRPGREPARLTGGIAVTASRMLAGDRVPVRTGSAGVIPQLRWLHEMERLNPPGPGGLRPDDIAPPLDFGLAGLPDWPGIRVADRLARPPPPRLALGSTPHPHPGQDA